MEKCRFTNQTTVIVVCRISNHQLSRQIHRAASKYLTHNQSTTYAACRRFEARQRPFVGFQLLLRSCEHEVLRLSPCVTHQSPHDPKHNCKIHMTPVVIASRYRHQRHAPTTIPLRSATRPCPRLDLNPPPPPKPPAANPALPLVFVFFFFFYTSIISSSIDCLRAR